MSPMASPSVSSRSRGRSGGNATNMSISGSWRWTPLATLPTRIGFASGRRPAIRSESLSFNSWTTSWRRTSSSSVGRIFFSTRASTGSIARENPGPILKNPARAGTLLVSSWREEAVQSGRRDHSVDDELDRDCGEEEAEDPGDCKGPRAADPPEDPVRIREGGIAREDAHQDPSKHEELVHRGGGPMGHVHHHRADRAGAREERDPERDDAHGLPLQRLRVFLLRRLCAGPLPMEHLEPDGEQEDSARNLERGNRDAEREEDPLAHETEDKESDERGEAALLDDAALIFRSVALREGREERHGTDRIDDGEDRGHGGQAEGEVHHTLEGRRRAQTYGFRKSGTVQLGRGPFRPPLS